MDNVIVRIDKVFETPLTDDEKAKMELEDKILKAKAYLAETDYKDLPRYKPKEGEDIEYIYTKRDELREFVRANDVSNS